MDAGNRWEQFARDRAEYYILTDMDPRGDEEALDRFFASGRQQAEAILADVAGWLRRFDTAIEIGCGVGRLAIPLAGRFRRVVAVDIAPTMLAKLRTHAARFGVENIETAHVGDAWHENADADFVFSWLVLQHVERLDDIRDLLRRTAAALRADGVASLQFDTRPATPAYRLRQALPDFLLPRPWRRGIRRVRRSGRELLGLFADCGLVVVAEHRPGTSAHVFILARS